MINNYIISSPGRSGCHLLVALIKSCGKNSIHTHDPFFNPGNFGDTTGKESALILLQRRDLFSSIMSMLVGKRTQQWNSYPNKVIPTFRVECSGEGSEFEHQYSWHKNYIQSCKTLQNYQQVKLLEFEDVVNDFDYVFRQLELTQLHPPILPEKAPYSYLDIIENIDECKIAFNRLESKYTFTPILEKYDPNRPN
jgi:LPS sulfotransferase NodH